MNTLQSKFQRKYGFKPVKFVQATAARFIMPPENNHKAKDAENHRRFRARLVARGLTTTGTVRKRKPSPWPLLDKQSHTLYMRAWRAARKQPAPIPTFAEVYRATTAIAAAHAIPGKH